MPNFEEPKQDLLFTDSINASEGYEKEEICFGIRFPSEKARRAHFTEELRKKLRDPEFRKIEGFPIGDDEDILNLSDPPYYTACPNPWVQEFIAEWESQKDNIEDHHREPFATDVSEGKMNRPGFTGVLFM